MSELAPVPFNLIAQRSMRLANEIGRDLGSMHEEGVFIAAVHGEERDGSSPKCCVI